MGDDRWVVEVWFLWFFCDLVCLFCVSYVLNVMCGANNGFETKMVRFCEGLRGIGCVGL